MEGMDLAELLDELLTLDELARDETDPARRQRLESEFKSPPRPR
jgi:hypothetical protein